MSESLTEQIKAAGNKEALAPLAEKLGVKVEKRKGLETLRADLLAVAEVAEEAAQGDTQGGDKAPPAAKGGKPKGRRLKNTTNGRVFAYSPRLAKRRDMKEV